MKILDILSPNYFYGSYSVLFCSSIFLTSVNENLSLILNKIKHTSQQA